MTIMTRFLRLLKADVHGVMDQLEDKGLLLRQYLREMETSLRDKEARLDGLSDQVERLSAHAQRHKTEMKKVDQDVDLALSKEKDDIARMLIRRHRDLGIAAGHLEEQISQLSQEKTRLVETLRDQKLQYDTLKARTEVWHQRAAEAPVVNAGRSFYDTTAGSSNDHDDEIELALIRRKAALDRQGGAK
jgi:phage shock protein A